MPVPCQRLHVSGLYQDCRKKASRRNFLHSVQHASLECPSKGKAITNQKREKQ
jgi:hypothetical protein